MKKNSFDLTGKAIDCRELSAMGDAGKEIFRALKLACNGVSEAGFASLDAINHRNTHLCLTKNSFYVFCDSDSIIIEGFQVFQPVDVLGQARIDAAKDGATLVFEGDKIPPMERSKVYWDDHSYSYEELPSGIVSSKYLIGYKLLEVGEMNREAMLQKLRNEARAWFCW